jgi:O-glycosyl hydrolase
VVAQRNADLHDKISGVTTTPVVMRTVALGAATSGGDAVAFKNRDGSIVTVMYNSRAAATYTLAVGGTKLQFAMPANGWASVDYVP